jgi:hypothetical protein
MNQIITGYRVNLTAIHTSGQQQRFSDVVERCDSRSHAIAILAAQMDLSGRDWQVRGEAKPILARRRGSD